MNMTDEKWLLCPICGVKMRLRLLERTVLRDLPLFCPKCRRASNFQIENVYLPGTKAQC